MRQLRASSAVHSYLQVHRRCEISDGAPASWWLSRAQPCKPASHLSDPTRWSRIITSALSPRSALRSLSAYFKIEGYVKCLVKLCPICPGDKG